MRAGRLAKRGVAENRGDQERLPDGVADAESSGKSIILPWPERCVT
jgi:hypothetical protein